MKTRYFSQKILTLIASLFVVATLTFFLMQAAPGDPFMQEQGLPEEIIKNLYAHYGLDQPWYVQYGRYLKNLLTWDLGSSFKYEGRTINDIISEGFPVSCFLGIQALMIAFFFGTFLGTIGAMYRSQWQGYLAMSLAVIGISVPNFILATFLQYFFAMKLDLFPVARWEGYSHTILPTLSLAALPTAFIARLIRAKMVEVLEQDYILTARSKGLSMFQVIRKHVLKNSLLPVVTYLGPLSSTIFSGSFVVEKIFGIPGLGNWFVTSVTNRDYTIIMGLTIFYSALLMISVFLVDLLYMYLDPRIQIIKEKE